jgi:tRNA threonylcarbamoyladenosine biosynthesis protein TsaE
MKVDLLSRSVADTLAIAGALGAVLEAGDVVALSGDLGAGKTVFCKGIGEALGIPAARIVSPSFTIVTEHRGGRVPFHHVDAYRLSSDREAEEAGLEEVVAGEGICAVEWADTIGNLLPNDCIRVTFLISGDQEETRRITVLAGDAPRFGAFLSSIQRFIRGG